MKLPQLTTFNQFGVGQRSKAQMIDRSIGKQKLIVFSIQGSFMDDSENGHEKQHAILRRILKLNLGLFLYKMSQHLPMVVCEVPRPINTPC